MTENEIKNLLLSDDIYEDKMEEVLWSLVAIANNQPRTNNEIFKVGSWRTIQHIVQLGLAGQYFQIGDQLQSYHGTYGTGEQHLLTWDIIGIDHDIPVDDDGNEIIVKDFNGNDINAHSITIQLHDCLKTKYAWTKTRTYWWEEATLRQWLNTDQVVDGFSSDPGFLNNFDPDLLGVIGKCLKSSIQASANVSSTGTHLIVEKITLPSTSEVFGGYAKNGYYDGAVLLSKDTIVNSSKQYYSKDSNGIITIVSTTLNDDRNPSNLGWYEVKTYYPYYGPDRSSLEVASYDADINRKKKVENEYTNWYLRSTHSPYSDVTVSYIKNDGSIQGNGTGTIGWSGNNLGISPCCIIC